MIKNIIKNREFQKYFLNTFWLFLEKLFRLVVGLLVMIWLTRYLGPKDFGTYSYTLSFVMLFRVLITLGLDNIVVRDLALNKSKVNEILGTSFILRAISSVVGILIVLLASNLFSHSRLEENLICIFSLAYIFQNFNVIDLYFQSQVKSKYVVIVNSISMAITSIMKIYLLLNNGSLSEFTFVYVVDSIIVALGLLYLYKQQQNSILLWKFNYSIAVKMLKDSSPLILSGSLTLVYTRVDQIMISNLLNSTEVGYYAAAVKLSEFWYFLPMLVVNSIFPKIIEYKQVSLKLYYNFLENLHKILYISSCIIVLLIFFNANSIIAILYGDSYLDSVIVLKIHIITLIFVALAAASSRWIYIENLQYTAIYRVLFAAILNVVLNYLFIPKYGIKAAAIATLMSQILSSYLIYGLISKTKYIFWVQTRTLLFINLFKRM
ncbi:MAG: O-unit flippase [Candidatus Cloacimonadota bacterium]|nr:MAG: O-unit flippase [Candidatus Cloacimonadota bacterium]